MAKQKTKSDKVEVPQLLLSQRLADAVDRWASDDIAIDQRWSGTTETTHQLLRYWFSRDQEATVRFHDCQRRAIETLVYVHEVLRFQGNPVETLDDLYSMAPEAAEAHPHIGQAVASTDYRKVCLKLATGTGKTWILQAAMVWQFYNSLRGETQVPYGQHFLVVTPGLVVLDRLLDAFLGKRDEHGNRDNYSADLVAHQDLFLPPGWRSEFRRLQIRTPEDIHPSSPRLDDPFVLLLNWHKLVPREQRQNLADELFGPDQDDSAYVYRDWLSAYPDLVIFNDEAHHVHSKVKGSGTDLDAKWLEAIKDLRSDLATNWKKPGLFMQVDFSATPFYGESAEKREYFPHIIYDYDLRHAMHGYSPVRKENIPLPLVKQLFLEERQALGGEDLGQLEFRAVREAEDGKKRGAIASLSHGQILLLQIGLNKLDQLADSFASLGLDKKPVLYVACEENDVADLVAEHLRTRQDSKGRPLGEQTLVVHSDKKHNLPTEEWERLRYDLDTIDQPEKYNPKRIVVSVMMLREGFDVKNICVAVILRASESPILLEQMVGRGVRLMFSDPAFYDSKLQALQDIADGNHPSAGFDYLFIVEHPKFRQFYASLRKEGYPVFGGDSSVVSATGDLIRVRADEARLARYDLGWPVQFHEEGRAPDPRLIDVAKIKRFPQTFQAARKTFGSIIIADRHEPSDRITDTWKFDTELFDYAFFLRGVSQGLVASGEDRTILSSRQSDVMAVLDEYVSNHLFGQPIDFTQEENYRVLAHAEVYEHVFRAMRAALEDLLGKVAYEPDPKAIWERVSKVPEILVRQATAVETQRSIYPRQAPAPKGGGFEARFMRALDKDASVRSFVKLDQHRHGFAVRYRNEFGIARDYFPDFLVKTTDRMYLVETKADKDMLSPVVSRKARAAKGWCESASRIPAPQDLRQPQEWEYVLLSEKTFARHGQAGFEALLRGCRMELEQLLAIGSGRLF